MKNLVIAFFFMGFFNFCTPSLGYRYDMIEDPPLEMEKMEVNYGSHSHDGKYLKIVTNLKKDKELTSIEIRFSSSIEHIKQYVFKLNKGVYRFQFQDDFDISDPEYAFLMLIIKRPQNKIDTCLFKRSFYKKSFRLGGH